MNVNDLLSSPSESFPNFGHASNKRPRSDTVQGPQDVLIPTLSSLMVKFPGRDVLYAHLATLPKAILISILLTEAKNSLPAPEAQSYGPSNNLAHCVYCHKLFDKTAAKYDCKVKHFGELDDTDDNNPDTRFWSCCGLVVDGYADYYPEGCHPPPEDDASQYCWEGRHFDRILGEADVDMRGIWWKEWEDEGQTCADLGCHNKPNGGHLDKRSKRQ